jgi:hypothetical protein
MKKQICLLLIACVGFLTFAVHNSEAKTKAPPDVGLVQSFDDVFTVNSADVSQETEVTHFVVNKYDMNEVNVSIIVREEKFFNFIETAILDKKTLIFDVLDWPGNSLAAKYNSTNLADYNVLHMKPISSYSCLHNPLG